MNTEQARKTYEAIRQMMIAERPKPEPRWKRVIKITLAIILFILSIPLCWLFAQWFAWSIEQSL